MGLRPHFCESSMKLLYTKQNRDIPEGVSARNPSYFDRPEAGVIEVYIDGDYPDIVKAYEALQINVTVIEKKPGAEQAVAVDHGAGADLEQMSVADLRKHLEGLGIELKAKATKAELLQLLAGQE